MVESASGEPVLVVQASTKTVYLGRLDVEFDGAGLVSDWDGDAILLSRYISPDPDISDLIAGLAEPIAELRAAACRGNSHGADRHQPAPLPY